ncbi:MAG: SRPBCC family protein, partial [Thermomicrobiales bacterium]|nr:SRPBCC family protein [Thermomicrobiales bacterium]
MTERSVTYRSHLPVSAAEALAWHGREGAFERLSPPWSRVRVIEARGTMHPGDSKRVKIAFGPLTTEWQITHEALPAGIGFLDRQVSGPFAAWTHEHRFEDDPAGGSWLEDRITYALPLQPAGNIAKGRVEAELNRTFAYRHQVTR